jgi:hypothetical protein
VRPVEKIRKIIHSREEIGGYLSSLRMARRATVGTPWVMVPVLSNTTEHITIIGYKIHR